MDEKLSVLIMCGGRSTRWEGDRPKQLVKVTDGEILLDRTIRQAIKTFGVVPMIEINESDEHAENVFGDYNVFYLLSYPYICETLRRMKELDDKYAGTKFYKGTTIILLGDVYYTDEAMRQIRDISEFAFGDHGEIFAIKFTEIQQPKLLDCLNVAVAHADDEGTEGKLWHLYRAWCGKDLFRQGFWGHFYKIEDETQDFDYWHEYVKFCEEHDLMEYVK